MASFPIRLVIGRDAALISDVIQAQISDLKLQSPERTDIDATQLQREPAILFDFLSEQGLFAAPKILTILGVSDKQHGLLSDWIQQLTGPVPENHFLFLGSTSIRTRSKVHGLLKSFPAARIDTAYETAVTEPELRKKAQDHGLTQIEPAAVEHLLQRSSVLTPLELQRLLEKLSLALPDDAPLTADLLRTYDAQDVATQDTELLTLLLSGSQSRLAAFVASRLETDTERQTAILSVSRNLSQIASTSARGLQPPWHLRDAASQLQTFRTEAARRCEAALSITQEVEAALRTEGVLTLERSERALMRICQCFEKKRRTA